MDAGCALPEEADVRRRLTSPKLSKECVLLCITSGGVKRYAMSYQQTHSTSSKKQWQKLLQNTFYDPLRL